MFLVMVMKQLVVKEGGQGFFFYWYGLFISLSIFVFAVCRVVNLYYGVHFC